MEKFLETIEKYILYLTVFLLPLAFLPLFPNAFDTPKLIVLLGGVSLALLLKAVKTFHKGSFEISGGTFGFPVALMGAAYLVSALVKTPNKMEAFFLPGTASVVLLSAVLYFLATSLSASEKKGLAISLFLSGLLTSVFFLLGTSKVLLGIAQLPPILKDPQFTPLGGALPLAIFLFSLLPLSLGLIAKTPGIVQKSFLALGTLIIAGGLLLSIANVFPSKGVPSSLPPFDTSWAVSIDTLKESPLFGIGPGNYLSAFNRFLPLSYNASDLWFLRFTSGRNFYLTEITETGLLGLVALLSLIFLLIKHEFKEGPLFSLVSLLVLLAVFPATLVHIVLLFTLLSLTTRAAPGANEGRGAAALILATLIILGVGALDFYFTRAVLAEYSFKKALEAATDNKVKETYDLMGAAIKSNPYVDRYHASFAQTNLALARSVAQKKDITDTDRNLISSLVASAIQEGKATVSLNSQRSQNWSLLAQIYQAIMPLAQGADNFAIQTYSQAVSLDPINPNLRIALGGIYYALGRYDEAIDAFKLATLAKNDLANSHYNLAIAYRDKGEIDKAIAEMKIVLTLVQKDSNDYKLAKSELNNLEKNKPGKTAKESENLTAPKPSPTPAVAPPLSLPEEAVPPSQ